MSMLLAYPTIWVMSLSGLIVLGMVWMAVVHRRHARLTDRKFCPHCTGVSPASSRFCSQCGRAV